MAGFTRHIEVATVSVGAISLLAIGIVSVLELVALIGIGIISTTFPDLDSDTSKPLQFVYLVLSIILPIGFLLYSIEFLNILETIKGMGYGSNVSLLIAYVICFILFYLLFKIAIIATTHRGVFHSIPMGIMFALIIMNMLKLGDFKTTFIVLAGFYSLFGFLVHLALDEFYSATGVRKVFGIPVMFRIKNSFGTAMKIYSSDNPAGYILVSIAVIFLSYSLGYGVSEYKIIFEFLRV